MEQTMILPVMSAYTAAILAILQVALMMAVGLNRQSAGISLGDGGNAVLIQKIRRHGNLAENAPIFIILLAFLESMGGPGLAVLGLASVFVLARFSHAYALSGTGKNSAFRAIGAMGTMMGIIGTAGTLVWWLSTAH